MTSISVVVAVYNGALSLPELTERLTVLMPTVADEYELIFVEDNGRDNSWAVLQELTTQYPHMRIFKHMRNFGQHNALMCGIRQAKGELVVTMDDDLQHNPEHIIQLLNRLNEGYDVVYGSPAEEQHSFFRNLASQVTKWVLQGAMGVSVARKVSAFRIFRTNLREAFARYDSSLVNLDVLLTWGTARFSAVDIPHADRKYGESNYTLYKLIVHALNMVTGFSTLPLQIASLVGFMLTFFGILILVYVVGRLLIESSVPGFPFLASIVAIFSGAQLFAIGIIGEYLARMYVRSMGKPMSVVREQGESKPESGTLS